MLYYKHKYKGREGERERETDRQTDRQTDRDRQTETEMETERERENVNTKTEQCYFHQFHFARVDKKIRALGERRCMRSWLPPEGTSGS